MITNDLFVRGQDVEFQNEGTGQIVEELDDAIYIISRFFTGWMLKAEYFDLLGVED
jgi:hypothetical protein